MRKTLISLPFLLVCLTTCLQDEPFKLAYQYPEPVRLEDDWEISSPEEEEIDPELLNKAYQLVYSDKRFLMARSLLVIRNGKLVAEAYPRDPADINKIHNIQSCTKSVTSILVGSAMQHEYISSLDEKLYSVYPEYFDTNPEKRDITLRHALKMQTGLEFDNSVHTLELYQTNRNSVEYVLAQEKLYDAGMIMNYNDGAPHLVSKYVEKKTGETLESFAAETLFAPLNIQEWKWEAANDGTTFGAFSLFLKARDFGKIGQLLLQDGKWKGEALIDSSYLSAASDIQASANFNSEPYGYYFWILPAYNAYAAVGHGGQFLLIVPEKNLVAVYTAWPYTNPAFFDQRNELMELIINSCK